MKMADSEDFQELEKLLEENPDWKERYPDIYLSLKPVRYHKRTNREVHRSNGYNFMVSNDRKSVSEQSHYQQTFYDKSNNRPPRMKRPPPHLLDQNPLPMDLETMTQQNFTPKIGDLRRQPIINKEAFEWPKDKIEFKTTNTETFKKPEIKLPMIVSKAEIKMDFGTTKQKFDTTSNSHFQKWNQGKVSPFVELPSKSKFLMYPYECEKLRSTTNETYKGEYASPPVSCAQKENTVKYEGDLDLTTTNSLMYKKYENVSPTKKKVKSPNLVIEKRKPLDSVSQTQKDYHQYTSKESKRVKAFTPPEPQIDLRNNNEMQFDTEQKRNFKAVDLLVNPPPSLLRHYAEIKINKDETIDGQSHSKEQYKQYEQSSYMPPMKGRMRSKRIESNPKFVDLTTNQELFKKWNVEPRKVITDPLEMNRYVPPKEKFDASTTTQATYDEKTASHLTSYKPRPKTVDKTGERYMNTTNGDFFKKPSIVQSFTKPQQQHLLKELRLMNKLKEKKSRDELEMQQAAFAVS